MFCGGAWIVGGWGMVGWGRKSFLEPAEIASFSSRNFSRSNKDDTFWHVVSTEYLYVLFLWTIAVLDFRPLKIYKNLGLPLSTITFTVNSHADNHFYEYLFVSNIVQCEFSLFFFLLKYTFRFWPRFFTFKFKLNVKHRSYFL